MATVKPVPLAGWVSQRLAKAYAEIDETIAELTRLGYDKTDFDFVAQLRQAADLVEDADTALEKEGVKL